MREMGAGSGGKVDMKEAEKGGGKEAWRGDRNGCYFY